MNEELIQRIRENDPTLTSIDVQYYDIGPEGAQALADALQVNKTLTSINLGSNNIGPEGARDLADALRVNKTLTSIDLGLNGIGFEGAQALADVLTRNTTLTFIDLSGISMCNTYFYDFIFPPKVLVHRIGRKFDYQLLVFHRFFLHILYLLYIVMIPFHPLCKLTYLDF